MIEKTSKQFKILEHLCRMPKPVRGASAEMLERQHQASEALADLSERGLVRARGWDSGPGRIWVPTEAGERLFAELSHPPDVDLD